MVTKAWGLVRVLHLLEPDKVLGDVAGVNELTPLVR
jgi:hypothetical protein